MNGTMRGILLSELVKDVLGPRNGPYEQMDDTPFSEYITGVLSPRDAEAIVRDPDEEADFAVGLPGKGDPLSEDDQPDDAPVIFRHTTLLDPRQRPHSIGVSFNVQVERGNNPCLDICITWARYYKDSGVWKRYPKFFVGSFECVPNSSPQRYFIDEAGKLCDSSSAEVSLYVITRIVSTTEFHISVFLVNEIKLGKNYVSTENCIFQPQIRINCVNGKIAPLRRYFHEDPEEKELDFIYRTRTVPAKGHMCSAIWKDIDPERPFDNEYPIKEPPFYWVDGEILPPELREKFSCPDVRTEFVPIFPVETPSYNWDARWGPKPELDARKLSETWNPTEVSNALNPLVNGYKSWISYLESIRDSMNEEHKEIATKIINRCYEILKRIRKGIDLLLSDQDARLAFCFANKAMDLQFKWKSRIEKRLEDTLKWRPFQLAFILLTLESIVNPKSPDRETCDLLSVPTGAGKTEAYLAIAAFTIAYRRRRALQGKIAEKTGGGVGVIMRYTLRLLTIQQFRRALRMITACEYLRVLGLGSEKPVGWRPKDCELKEDFIWGTLRFSLGLWVGGSVSPNRILGKTIQGRPIYGAVEILQGKGRDGEPAQVLECPACGAILSIPEAGLRQGKHTLFLIVSIGKEAINNVQRVLDRFKGEQNDFTIAINDIQIHEHNRDFVIICLELISQKNLQSSDIDGLWERIEHYLRSNGLNLRLRAARASRPGYFILKHQTPRGTSLPYNFEVICPNPFCPLNNETYWAEGRPHAINYTPSLRSDKRTISAPDGLVFVSVPDFMRADSEFISQMVPIPALTVDEQIYCYPPSFIVGTVDKVARISFEPRCGALFGNVDHYHAIYGYYRAGLPPPSSGSTSKHPRGGIKLRKEVTPFNPPDLIIQDELHLIEGPLGSMVGIYESAVDYLASQNDIKVKYVASTATVRGAPAQVHSIFLRKLMQFPPHGLFPEDRFFIRFKKLHPLEEKLPGRLYVGICAPGLGPLTPVVRIWSRLLQTVYELSRKYGKQMDPFWTLVGYFNAIRELAGARSLYRQDIPERIRQKIGRHNPRPLYDDRAYELSSRTHSTDLPTILSLIESPFSGDPDNPQTPDALFTTSMFGTGVDVPRLSLMVVHGQPKTTSAYIQSTGRVGRKQGGLVVTFYRATRPRDLSHYEMFCGYHMNLERFVEPVTAAPFSPGTLARCIGPVIVGMLRNMPNTSYPWHEDISATAMAAHHNSPEVKVLPDIFEKRAVSQPASRAPTPSFVQNFVLSQIDRWRQIAQQERNLKYVEYIIVANPVVLGDPPHQHRGLSVVYKNAPQSLRDIEGVTCFET